MSRRLRLATAVLLLLLPAATSCRWFRKPKPVPRPAQIPVQTEPAKPAPPAPLEPPPGIPTAEPKAGGIPGEEPQPLPPPPPAKKRPSPAGPRVPTAPPEPAETPPATPAPQLRPMLAPAQRQELERSINERIRRTQGILASIGTRSLRGDLADLARQIRTFLKQAEEARGTDLLRANNLAERAEVLAEDLAKRLR